MFNPSLPLIIAVTVGLAAWLWATRPDRHRDQRSIRAHRARLKALAPPTRQEHHHR